MIGRRPLVDPDDCTVVVTGASSGIGRLTAVELAARGARVVLVARSAAVLQRVAAECQDAGGQAEVVPTDVSDESAVRRVAERAIERFGHFDAWINDAAVIAFGRYDEVPLDVHRRIVEVNLLGTMYGSWIALEHFVSQGRGALVNVASLYGDISTPYVAGYATTKSAIIGLTRSIRYDVGRQPHIGVSCVLPSSVDTPVWRNAGNYVGRRAEAIPPTVDPARVSRAVIKCLERPRRQVRVGWVGRAATLGEHVLPGVYDRLVAVAMERLAFRDDSVERNDGNLFYPTPERYAVSGGWQRGRRRRRVGWLAIAAVSAGAVLAGGRFTE